MHQINVKSGQPLAGQFYTVTSPPPPKTRQVWLAPIVIGVVAVPLLMIGFGFAQQQAAINPTPAPAPQSAAPPTPVSPSAPKLQTDLPLSEPPPLAPNQELPQLNAQIGNCSTHDSANLRKYPTLDNSVILDAIACEEMIYLTGEQIKADGVTWLAAEWQGLKGWIAKELVVQVVPSPHPFQPPNTPSTNRFSTISYE